MIGEAEAIKEENVNTLNVFYCILYNNNNNNNYKIINDTLIILCALITLYAFYKLFL